MIIGAIIGATFAIRVEMTQMPQMVAIFNGFGGGAAYGIYDITTDIDTINEDCVIDKNSREKRFNEYIEMVDNHWTGHLRFLLTHPEKKFTNQDFNNFTNKGLKIESTEINSINDETIIDLNEDYQALVRNKNVT